MKKIILLWSLILIAAEMQSQTINGIYYKLNDNGTAEVSFNKYSGSLTIPSSVVYNSKTYSVTSIGDFAFSGSTGLTSVTIPNSVTSIGEGAFDGCTSLASITIPNSVTSIGKYAFYKCSGLTSVTIGNSVTRIGDSAFDGCTGLTSVTIPNSVTSIGEDAFYDCTGLTSVVIGNSVTSIEKKTFYGCTSLTSVVIGNSVKNIGDDAFYQCTSLTSVVWNAKNCADFDVYDSYPFYYCTQITSFELGIAVERIPDYLCYGMRGLTSVTIGNSVKSIGEGAFSGCDGLTSIEIPNSVTSIGNGTFADCSGLTSIVVEQGNTKYDSRDNCNAIIETATNTLIAGCQNTVIPNSVTSIGNYAFEDCRGLTSITIPNSVTNIGNYAFNGCWGLKYITIPNSVTSIGICAFNDCHGLTSITIPNSVTSIGMQAFGFSDLESVILGSGLKTIDDNAFYYTDDLQSITCYSMTPPTIIDYFNRTVDAFYTLPYSTIVYVPADYLNTYKKHSIWGKYDVRPLGAASVQVDDLLITPHYTTIDVTWPSVANAASYEITITSNGVVICKLSFDAQGQLTSISFRAPAAESARAAGQGFQFTVTGLDGGNAYSLTIKAKDAAGNVLQTFSQDFTTEGYTAIENVNADGASMKPRKVLEEGRVVILMPDGRKFDTNGRALGK